MTLLLRLYLRSVSEGKKGAIEKRRYLFGKLEKVFGRLVKNRVEIVLGYFSGNMNREM